jgi:hypothetical protein
MATAPIKVNILMQVEGSPVSNTVGTFELPVTATLEPRTDDNPEVTARLVFDKHAVAEALREAASIIDGA